MKKSTNNKDVPGRRQPGVHATPTSIAGTNGPIRDWLPALGLGRASRPGSDSGAANLGPAVDRWVKTVRAHGIRSVICLLSQEELDRYAISPEACLAGMNNSGWRRDPFPCRQIGLPCLRARIGVPWSSSIKTCPSQCWCIVVPGFTGAGLRCATSNRSSPILFWRGISQRVRRCPNEQTIDVNS